MANGIETLVIILVVGAISFVASRFRVIKKIAKAIMG
jgi:hypothetical protein